MNYPLLAGEVAALGELQLPGSQIAAGKGPAEHKFRIHVIGTTAELQLAAVQTGTSVAVRIEFAIIGGVSPIAAKTSSPYKLSMAIKNAADFLTGSLSMADVNSMRRKEKTNIKRGHMLTRQLY
jgi:hypothetical protein